MDTKKTTPTTTATKKTEPSKPQAAPTPENLKSPAQPAAATTTSAESVTAATTPGNSATKPTTKAKKGTKPETTVIISIGVSSTMARQIRLLCAVEGLTLSRFFVASVEKQIPGRLKAAMASLADPE